MVSLLRHPVRRSVSAWFASEDDLVGRLLFAPESVLLRLLCVFVGVCFSVRKRTEVDVGVGFGAVGAYCLTVEGFGGEMARLRTRIGERGE